MSSRQHVAGSRDRWFMKDFENDVLACNQLHESIKVSSSFISLVVVSYPAVLDTNSSLGLKFESAKECVPSRSLLASDDRQVTNVRSSVSLVNEQEAV